MASALPTYEVSAMAKSRFDDQHEIKGTYFYPEALGALFSAEGGTDNQEFFVPVTLVPEPDNPYSSQGHAISVRWRDRVIGHIASATSDNYQSIRRVAASGFDAQAKARIWTNKKYSGERQFWVTVMLPEPDLLTPLNDPPADGFALLPPGGAVQVTKEADHINVLSEYVPQSGIGQILATLHIIEAGVRKTWECIEVRIDGERIGELSKASSEKYTAVVRHFDDLGLTTVSRAKIQGSSLAAEVVLHSAKSHELTEEQLDPVDFQPLPKLVDFEPNPADYIVPNRWQGETTTSKNYAKRSRAESSPTMRPAADPGAVVADRQAAAPDPVWWSLLTPDGTPRATPFQRGFTRGTIGKHLPGNRAPRIDYATVGQCERILEHFGEDSARLSTQGRSSWALWWTLVTVVTLLVILLSLIPGIGGIFPLIWLIVVIHHFWTRRKLPAPFKKQQ